MVQFKTGGFCREMTQVKDMGKRTMLFLLSLIMVTAFVLRIWGINWGIPQAPYWEAYHPDEKVGFKIIYRISTQQDDLNPHYFINPSWHYYVMGAVNRIASGMKLIPSFRQLENDQATLEDCTKIWLVSRMISVILGTLTVWLGYLIAVKLFNDYSAGLLTAWMLAVNPVLVVQSHYITVDGPAVSWFLLAFYLLLVSFDNASKIRVLLAGLAAGLAAATKYTALLMVVAAIIAYGYRALKRKEGRGILWGIKSLALYAAGMAAGFIAGCPYAVLAFGEFRQGLAQMSSYNNFATDLLYPWWTTSRLAMGWPVWLMILPAVGISLAKPKIREVLPVSLALVFFIMTGYRASPYFRHFLLALPFVVLTIINAVVKIKDGKWFWGKTAVTVIILGWLMIGSAYALANSIAWVRIMAATETRDEAAAYISQHYPVGSRIAVPSIYEFYSPNLDNFDIIRLEYNQDKLAFYLPQVIVAADYETEGRVFLKRTQAEADDFFRMMAGKYRPVKKIKRTPNCCGLRFAGFPITDWRYFYPEITVYERSF